MDFPGEDFMTIELLPGLAGDKALSCSLCYPFPKLRGLLAWYPGIVVLGAEKTRADSPLSDTGALSVVGEVQDIGILLTSDLW